MARTLEVEVDGAAAMVVRRATGPEDVAHLRTAAERLAAAAHPGVVEVVSSQGDGEAWELRLVHAGRPVDVVGRLSAEQVAGIAAAVAATLADLHALGIVHGNLDASHVLLGAHGRPVLCGFGAHPRVGAGPEDDVSAVGALLVALLGTDADLDPIPARRWLRGDGQGWARRSLLLLADHACAEPATRRPSAQRLAAAIAEAVPATAVVPPVVPAMPAPRPAAKAAQASTHGRGAVLVASAIAVLLLGGVALRLSRPVAISHSASGAMTTTTTPPTTTPTRSTEVSLVPPTVTFDGRRYEIGRPGDLAVLGDWDGDLVPTPALLRPSTGEVFVFPYWTMAADLLVDATVTVPGAVELVVVPAGDRDQLAARRNDGSERTVV